MNLVSSVAIGCAVASLPWLASLTNMDSLLDYLSLILLPGMIVGMAMGGGGVHNPNWTATLVATAIFWAWIAYMFIRWLGRRKAATQL